MVIARLLVVAISVLSLLLAGCDTRPGNPVTQQNLRIFTTVYVMSDLAKEVGGKYVDAEFAVESGQSLADFQVSPALRQRMNDCQLIVACGTIDQWAVGDATNPYASGRVIRFDALAQATDPDQSGLLWLDPAIAEKCCDELAKRLATFRPEHDLYFANQAKQIKAKLDTLIIEYREKFMHVARRKVLALSYDFDPLANRFNVDVVHPFTTTPDRLDDELVRQLVRASDEQKIKTLIVRSDTPPALVQDLSQRSGLRIIRLDAYGSSAATGRDTYISLLKYDLDQLLRAAGTE